MNSAKIVLLSVSIAMVAGCARQEDGVPSLPPGPLADNGARPCQIALSPHSGRDGLDADIIQWQRRAHSARDPAPYIERLGWAYVGKARGSADPGFYILAGQAAACLEARGGGREGAQLLRGHVLHNLHRFREAERLARRLVAERGTWMDLALLGDVLMEQGRVEGAVVAYQRMMDQRPGPHAYVRAANVRWVRGDLSGAADLMRKALRSTGGRRTEAVAWYLVRLADLETQLGQATRAHRHLEAATGVQPGYPPALLAQSRLALTQGDGNLALELLEQATHTLPQLPPQYLWARIDALRVVGRAAQAEVLEQELITRGVNEDPRTLALYLATQARLADRAVNLARRELRVREDVRTLDAMAWALYSAREYQAARQFSLRALAEGTQDARLFVHAAHIAAAVGDQDEGRAWLKKARAAQWTLWPSERIWLQREFATSLANTPLSGRVDTALPGQPSREPGEDHVL